MHSTSESANIMEYASGGRITLTGRLIMLVVGLDMRSVI